MSAPCQAREDAQSSGPRVAGQSPVSATLLCGALVAFTRALAANPRDPRALAERGYVVLLAKRNGRRAEQDLRCAAEAGGDRRLRAQIFFNLGLVREADGRDGTTACALSNTLHATEAARQN